MKKFMMYVIVLVAILFVGYTTYYFARNNEEIKLTLAESEIIFLNKGEQYDLPLVWTKPYKSTKVYENISVSNKNVVSFNAETKKFTALTGGVATITITPSNSAFGPFVFDISVGDGTQLNPYYVRNAEALYNIGRVAGDEWKLSHCYQLINDIDLKLYKNNEWEPIGTVLSPFTGTFDGNGKTISNLRVVSFASAGLFGAIGNGGVVENVNINAALLQGNFDYAGIISGVNYGKIGKCFVKDGIIKNNKTNSYSGGITGLSQNTLDDESKFNAKSYIDMCSVSVSIISNGTIGGICGNLTGSVVYNCKAIINNLELLNETNAVGGLVGIVMPYSTPLEYRFSVIKNSYVVVHDVLNESSKLGVVVGINQDNGTDFKNTFIGIYYSYSNTAIPAVATTTDSIPAGAFTIKTFVELQQQDTYKDWNFKDVWTIDEGASLAEINFVSGDYVSLDVYEPGNNVENKNEFEDIINALRNDPSKEVLYEIKQSIEIDLEDAEWQTIAPNSNNPLRSSIVCAEGVTVTIKNFKLLNANHSFFGYISGTNTKISGFVFENVIVDVNLPYVAVVSNVLTNATLERISVLNANIKAGELNLGVGALVGYSNRGVLQNSSVNNERADSNVIISAGNSVNIGGAVGYNGGTMKYVAVEMLTLNVPSNLATAYAAIGGLTGRNDYKMENCYNYDVLIKQQFTGTMYAGGVAGFSGESSIIEMCFAENIMELNTSNQSISCGGITGYLASNATIIKSYFAYGLIQAYKVAGITPTNHGNIEQCYFSAEAIGIRVGGLVNDNFGLVNNCYVLGSLKGVNSSSVLSGFASILHVGSVVNHCFSSVSFTGQGSYHAETESEFRVIIEKVLQIFDKFPDTGELKNCIVVNYGTANVKTGFFGLISKGGFLKCTDSECKGLIGDYSIFKNDASFDQAIWVFERGENGAYPTLANVVVNPRSLPTETTEEETIE